MKLSQILFKQHKGRLARYIWNVQRERPIQPTSAEKILSSLNIKIEDAINVVGRKKDMVTPVTVVEQPEVETATNLALHSKSAHMYSDKYMLQAGMSQAQLLTKTVIIANELPKQIECPSKVADKAQERIMKRIITTSTIFDAHQEKLPKVKDPERPAWVFPRSYGITRARKMNSLTRKFLQYCEILSGYSVSQHRNIIESGHLSTCLNHGPDLISLSATLDFMLASSLSLEPIIKDHKTVDPTLPDLYPLHHMLGLPESKTYTKDVTAYPIHEVSTWMKPHTIVVHYDPEDVKNITELPVTEEQVLSHALMKTFLTAACYARKKFGADVKRLQKPVTLQCIHTDGQNYNFGVFQLNTLDLENKDDLVNYWWQTQSIKLYDQAGYEDARPVLSGYNPEVFNRILAFYHNRLESVH